MSVRLHRISKMSFHMHAYMHGCKETDNTNAERCTDKQNDGLNRHTDGQVDLSINREISGGINST